MTAEVSLLESRLHERQLAVARATADRQSTASPMAVSRPAMDSCGRAYENVLIELGARHGRRPSDPKGAAELLRPASSMATRRNSFKV